MDELHPPKELADLWLGREPAPENVDAIAHRALTDAAKYARVVRKIDFMWAIPSAIIAVFGLWFVAGQSAAEALFFSVVLVGNLVEWWRFRVAACRPLDPSLPTQEHVSFSIGYLALRARFLRRTAWWAAIVMPPGAILMAAMAISGDPDDALNRWIAAGLMLIVPILGVWWTRYELRRIAGMRAPLEQILADLSSAPPLA